jgi:hypothetical protein
MSNYYWVSFEFFNGGIGTWADYADTADEFITELLTSPKGKRIKRFEEMHLDQRDGMRVDPPEIISVDEYNSNIKRIRRGKVPAGIYLETSGDDHVSVAYIALGSWSRNEKDGPILISPDCMSYREVESWADIRIAELEKVKQKARRLFPKL